LAYLLIRILANHASFLPKPQKTLEPEKRLVLAMDATSLGQNMVVLATSE
jgi:hypothetical protein